MPRRVRWLTVLLLAIAPSIALAKNPASSPNLDDLSYRMPPKVVADVLTAPRLARGAPSVSPDGTRMLLPDLPSLIPIALLAEPVEKLAGLEILPAMRATRTQIKYASNGFRIVTIADGKKVRAQLPKESRVVSVAWSTRGDKIACATLASGGAEVWIVNAASGVAQKLKTLRMNTVLTADIEWSRDDAALFAVGATAPFPVAQEPKASVPSGPQLRVGAGKATPMRTARDVLRTPEDQARFGNLTSAALLRVPVDGTAAKIVCGQPGIRRWTLSPDEKSVALTRIEQTPLGFAYELFPRVVEVRSVATGAAVKLADVPLDDRSAISSVASLGPREFQWGADGKALYFFSWEDKPGADAMAAVKDTSLPQPGTDRIMRLDAPFTGTPAVVATSDFQLRDMLWTADGRKLIVREGYQPRRRERMWYLDVMSADGSRRALYERSTEGVYDDPGRTLTREQGHHDVAWTAPDGNTIYLAGDGFRPTGQQPFLDAYNLMTRDKKRIYESDADHLEPALALLTADAGRFITLRQSNREPPNYQVREAGGTPRALGDATDPAPALTASQRVQFKFTRPDSVKLNAEIVLPADWKPGTPLPTIFWVYPNDYRSAAAASQNRRAPNRFPSQSPLNPEVLVTQGYAVLYPDIAVVGTNDKYVEEIQMSAKAALDEVVRRGWTDPRRVGVGGHSYGAFSTANLLAHTDLFRAGIASDGAYNRTLTPFTFQAEERTLWEARDTYLKMSPFLYADQIQAPLLLLHNMDDTNVGTNPIQSQRMYEALNGLGRVVSLVEYPYEDHGPAAKESVLDYWARVIDWYDRYVKNAPESAAK